MTDQVPATQIEDIVGVPRLPVDHVGRAVSAEQKVYILHGHQCVSDFEDLRDCPFSRALDDGINLTLWVEDRPLILEIDPVDGLKPTLAPRALDVSSFGRHLTLIALFACARHDATPDQLTRLREEALPAMRDHSIDLGDVARKVLYVMGPDWSPLDAGPSGVWLAKLLAEGADR